MSKHDSPKSTEIVPRPVGIRRGLCFLLGMLSLCLGLLGVVMPVLPTTPFLLLAASCFLRSSERMHRWLLNNRVFGEYLRSYRAGEGLRVKTKATILATLWLTLAISAFWAIPNELWWVRIILGMVGVGVSFHILRIKTKRSDLVR